MGSVFLTGGLVIHRLISGRVPRDLVTRAVDEIWAGIAAR